MLACEDVPLIPDHDTISCYEPVECSKQVISHPLASPLPTRLTRAAASNSEEADILEKSIKSTGHPKIRDKRFFFFLPVGLFINLL